MKRKRFWWELAGFLFVAAAGALAHFLYVWSGESRLAAAFSAVNESVWEHMKLLYVPAFLFTSAQLWADTDNRLSLLAVRSVSLLAGTVLIPMLYYTYTGVLGRNIDWVNIALFFLADAVLFLLDRSLLRRRAWSAGWQQALGLAVLWGGLFLFIWCTYYPVPLPLWQDPRTLTYGIP